ncbi:MAG: hypothetical protein JEZ06_15695 [Anaerolineaceae bacterium]|nr:hypothetical protein [Anaerolineaceae bacterium]
MFETKYKETFQPVGHCIYCGANNQKLTDEHIIPFGLGGKLILPKSSCPNCSLITSQFEQFCLRPFFGNPRMVLDLPTRLPKERPKKAPMEYIGADGKRHKSPISLEEVPLIILGFNFPEPRFLMGLPPTEEVEGDLVARYIDNEIQKRFLDSDVKQIKLGSVNILLFSRMIAKIAHSFAISQLGYGTFNPFLTDLILGNFSQYSTFVGGYKNQDNLKFPEVPLHYIYMKDISFKNNDYISVVINLFAFADMPTYQVIVGVK